MKEQKKIPEEVERLLVEQAELINSTDFIASDPVQFPRRFSDLRDIEIVAILSATIACGITPRIAKGTPTKIQIINPYTKGGINVTLPAKAEIKNPTAKIIKPTIRGFFLPNLRVRILTGT